MTQSGAVNLGLDLCSALCSLREAGLIHRDVKPSNVYLSSSGTICWAISALQRLTS